MALGDGETWDETVPNNDTNISDGDDHQVQIKKAFRIRFNKEHLMPASQTGSSLAGYHRHITFQPQTTNPSSFVVGTTAGAMSMVTSGSGYELFVSDSAGNDVQITDEGKLAIGPGSTTGDGVTLSATGQWTRTPGVLGFRAGDLLLSEATSAPSGWSEVSATYENKYILVGTGSPMSTGGVATHDHEGTAQSHTLIVSEIPSHVHGIQTYGGVGGTGNVSNAQDGSSVSAVLNSNATGGGGGHTHVITAASNNPLYVAVRMYKKD